MNIKQCFLIILFPLLHLALPLACCRCNIVIASRRRHFTGHKLRQRSQPRVDRLGQRRARDVRPEVMLVNGKMSTVCSAESKSYTERKKRASSRSSDRVSRVVAIGKLLVKLTHCLHPAWMCGRGGEVMKRHFQTVCDIYILCTHTLTPLSSVRIRHRLQSRGIALKRCIRAAYGMTWRDKALELKRRQIDWL